MERKKNLKAKARSAKLPAAGSLIADEEILVVEEENRTRSKKVPLMVVLAIVILALGAFLFKEKFVVAIVNGRPIFRSQLDRELVSIYGKDTLENLIVEKAIKEEVAKQKVKVDEKEIDDQISQLTKGLGEGTNIEEILAAQGLTMPVFREQIKLRLQVNRILEKDITVSDEEIGQFIKDNEKSMTATTEAGRKDEAKKAIKDQKLSTKVQEWVNGLLEKAKVSRFLK